MNKKKQVPEKWSLEELFATVIESPSMRVLQNVVYILQEQGIFEKRYEFLPTAGTYGLPFSIDLERDVSELERRGLVFQR